jgi:hypothetical protein
VLVAWWWCDFVPTAVCANKVGRVSGLLINRCGFVLCEG